jgi:hypothetical protein
MVDKKGRVTEETRRTGKVRWLRTLDLPCEQSSATDLLSRAATIRRPAFQTSGSSEVAALDPAPENTMRSNAVGHGLEWIE